MWQAVEVKPKVLKRTASGSNLDQLLYGSAIPTRTSSSFVFTLSHTSEGQAEPEVLYGCCLRSTDLLCYEATPEGGPSEVAMKVRGTRSYATSPVAYCLLSRFPFFEMHFGVLYAITEELHLRRLEALPPTMDEPPPPVETPRIPPPAARTPIETSMQRMYRNMTGQKALAPPPAAVQAKVKREIKWQSQIPLATGRQRTLRGAEREGVLKIIGAYHTARVPRPGCGIAASQAQIAQVIGQNVQPFQRPTGDEEAFLLVEWAVAVALQVLSVPDILKVLAPLAHAHPWGA